MGVVAACSLFLENCYTVQLSEGPSMYPTMNSMGEFILISRRYSRGSGIEVGDVVRFYHPSFAGTHVAKRVLGMPGDFVCKDPPLSSTPGSTGEMIQVWFFLPRLFVAHTYFASGS